MEAFEIGHLRLVTGFDEGLVAGLDERSDATAKDGLLTEEVGFGFFFEGRLNDARARAANAFGPGQCDLLGLLARVLVNGDQSRDAFAFGVLPAHNVPGTFRGYQNYIDVV